MGPYPELYGVGIKDLFLFELSVFMYIWPEQSACPTFFDIFSLRSDMSTHIYNVYNLHLNRYINE